LDVYEKMDCKLRGEHNGNKAKILNAPNFLALLNLPYNMLMFGPLRLLWEGDNKGEGILRWVKPLIHGLGKNWAYNALRWFYVRKALDSIARRFENNGDDGGQTYDDPRERGERYHAFHVYTEEEARLDFAQAAALSVVGLEDGSFGVAIKGGKVLELEKLGGAPAATACGAEYWGWALGQLTDDIDLAKDGAIRHACLFLRYLDPDTAAPAVDSHFYAITSEWLELLSSGEVGLPPFPGATYA
jgi:hypothetical protein